MTAVDVMVVRGLPLVRLIGPVTERSGAELATAVMDAIYFYSTDVPGEFPHPLSERHPQSTL
ncbi:hypothetical protein [[Mycobacterium] burgundiense]|uniref:CBS domain-containing protein n=1 Tax=[Mycobacterium] burgundiense TaxID=3064286 RepID=A0ABM9LV66_9MYCO|nr:hypothetical protein [Mycolicibacterium sp. MU0053]CAJ1505261.1 hypothetical protein MU0053_002890 [Mycolicibacterium sp. MU0053]